MSNGAYQQEIGVSQKQKSGPGEWVF